MPNFLIAKCCSGKKRIEKNGKSVAKSFENKKKLKWKQKSLQTIYTSEIKKKKRKWIICDLLIYLSPLTKLKYIMNKKYINGSLYGNICVSVYNFYG